MAAGLVPGATAAAMTIAAGSGAHSFGASDRRLEELHRLQFHDGAGGPVAETLRHNEPRRIDDTGTERRWPEFCAAAARAGFGSCLALPLRTDRHPAGAVALYGEGPDVFRGTAHDIALLFAAQGGTAVRNAALYRRAGAWRTSCMPGWRPGRLSSRPRASSTPSWASRRMRRSAF